MLRHRSWFASGSRADGGPNRGYRRLAPRGVGWGEGDVSGLTQKEVVVLVLPHKYSNLF